MSDLPVHFLPWMRRGLATQIEESAVIGLAQSATTSAIADISVVGDGSDTRQVTRRPVELYGPGSVTALTASVITKRTPSPGANDVEPNYFAFVELASPDLPWRFTPAAPDNQDRLQPWLALVVVEDRPGVWIQTRANALPILHVDDTSQELPPADDVWAWAHVQVQHDLPGGDLGAAFESDPDAFKARLMCPRRLEADRSWIACLVPTFEAGRLAGIDSPGSDVAGLAWSDSGTAELPVYDSWTFSSGPKGDFESLVRKLTPQVLPDTVGVRDLDVSNAGSGVEIIEKGVLSFQGALVAPTIEPKKLSAKDGKILSDSLRMAVNATLDPDPDPASGYDPLIHDPVVAPSAYGRPQMGGQAVPEQKEAPVWFGQLNTRPQHRTVAGLGAEVVRNDQEHMMDVAWDTARELTDVNRRLTTSRLAIEATAPQAEKLKLLDDGELMQRANYVLRQLPSSSTRTAWAKLIESAVPTGLAAGSFRRIARPNNGLGSKSGLLNPALSVTSAFLADPLGPIGSYRNIVAPAGAEVKASNDDDDLSAELKDGLTKDLSITGAMIAYVDDELTDKVSLGGGLARADSEPALKKATTGPPKTASSAGLTAKSASITSSSSSSTPGIAGAAKKETVAADFSHSADFEATAAASPALRELLESSPALTLELTRPDLDKRATTAYEASVDLEIVAELRTALDPHTIIANALRVQITAPDSAWTEEVPPKMWAGPVFNTPFYERIRDLSVEYLVPGVGDIPDETLGTMLTNDAYVESFLVGVNHELAREFLWREFPARLNATWCHQFWNGPIPDIPDIASFKRRVPLGSQDGSAQSEVVLLIKGAFPRRYPDVLVYAVEAKWVAGDDENPRQEKKKGEVHAPVFAGELQPGVVFYGFDLKEDRARGSTKKNQHPGFFFVLEEQPKGPRFGLDVGEREEMGATPEQWFDLSWGHVTEAGSDVRTEFVDLAVTSWLAGAGEIPSNGGDDTWADSAAAMARITLQRPMRLLVHADAMLPASEMVDA